MNTITAIVLAAGQGTRMNSSLPKVLHTVGHRSLLGHVEDLLEALAIREKTLVTAPSMHDIREAFPSFSHGIQEEPLGTAHAVLAAPSAFASKKDVLVLYGDTPMISPQTLERLIEARGEAAISILGMVLEDPAAYGRILCDEEGIVERIVEFKDASPEEQSVPFCNSGIMLISGDHALPLLEQVQNKNAKGEYYLTDVVELASQRGLKTIAVEGDPDELKGVNSQSELAEAEMIFQERQRLKFLGQGVRMEDPTTVYFSHDTILGKEVHIEPHVYFGPKVRVCDGATLKAFSHIEGSNIGEKAIVGPFARLRPGADLKEKVRIGNFVEVKKSTLEEGVKVSHLSYIGDATLGKGVNIGAGTITCNYDGYQKHQTIIGDNVFIGSNTALVAPLTIGENALVGAGSTLTQNVEKDSLALSRKEQANIKMGAKRFRAQRKKD